MAENGTSQLDSRWRIVNRLAAGRSVPLDEEKQGALALRAGMRNVFGLGTVPGAVHRCCHIVVVEDALCSASDETHGVLEARR